jgi:hypothetical protein
MTREETMTITRAEAQEYSESLSQIGEGWWRQIRWAQRVGVPASLDMTDREWAEVYHGYLRLAIEDRREAVNELLAAEPDLTNQQVGDALGVSKDTARRDRDASAPDGRADLGKPDDHDANAPEPDPGVTDYLDGDQRAEDLEYVRSFLKALSVSNKIIFFDPDRLGPLLAEDDVVLLDRHAKSVNDLFKKARQARQRMRLVTGGKT